MITTVLFDLDGTLLDTNELIADSWRYTYRTLNAGHITDDEIRSTMGETIPDSMRRLLPGIDVDHISTIYRDYQRAKFLDGISLFDGAEDVLRTLKADGYKIGVVTSRMAYTTGLALKHFSIEHMFDTVVTATDTDKHKPDPTPLHMALDAVGSKPEESVFIGDTIADIKAGRSAGIFTMFVDWSFALPPEKRATAPVPDLIVTSLRDIPSFIASGIPAIPYEIT
ncbi:MAG: HAD-IA family hydrolase [Clostridiales bacterium]|nr:HAD-IA family hydrolase [Clostridiales bacterium]